MAKFGVLISLKPEIPSDSDPRLRELHALGFDCVLALRGGQYAEVDCKPGTSRSDVEEMSRLLLANLVTHTFEVIEYPETDVKSPE